VIPADALHRHEITISKKVVELWTRKASSADAGVLQQIFSEQEYYFEHWAQGQVVRRLYDGARARGIEPLVIDAGANIGASAIYFRALFPEARIIAVEPAPDNLELLRMNCAKANVTIVEGAVGAEDGTMHLVDPGGGEWAYRVEAQGAQSVTVHSMNTLLRMFESAFPLVCKIDIEGGEADLFSKHTGWVDRFPLLVIELHDWLLPFKGTAKNFLRTIGALDFEIIARRENHFCFNASFFEE
jgi:FkbM family methyltransferase